MVVMMKAHTLYLCSCYRNPNMNSERNGTLEEKWTKLRSVLVEMRDSEVPEMSPTTPASPTAVYDQTSYLQVC